MSHTLSSNEDWVMLGGTLRDNAVALPIKLRQFYANCEGIYNQIKFETENENNVSHYLIESSEDAINWKVLTNLTAKGSYKNDYAYTIQNGVLNDNYFRLTEIDKDGGKEIFWVVYNKCDDSNFMLYPNPSQGTFSILNKSKQTNLTAHVYDNLGVEILQGSFNDNQMIQFAGKLSPSCYTILIMDESKEVLYKRKLSVQ